MTSLKAVLSVVLKANDVVVAETVDTILWQRVLEAIHNGTLLPEASNLISGDLSAAKGSNNIHSMADSAVIPLDQLAQQLGIDKVKIEGACSPRTELPYMHLDPRCWEEMRKQVPRTGKLAIAPAVAAATLLLLWAKKADLGNITQSQARAVLGTIKVIDKNPSRSINNASWLQIRPGQIVLNPAEISKAVRLAACFCTKDWKAWTESNRP